MTKKAETNQYSKDRFEKVKSLLKEGLPMQLIAESLQMSRVTVSKYSKMDVPPKRSFHPFYNYSEYQDIIDKGFSEGKAITSIFTKMAEAGFKGSRDGFYKQYREYPMRTNPGKKTLSPKHQLISARKILRFLRLDDLSKIKNTTDRDVMIALLGKNKILEKLRHLMLSFKDLILGRDDSLLEDWIKRTVELGKTQLKTFVNGLMRDIPAVRNAINTSWSNGQVEGQVNRRKSIKRQMYGRAGLELLRRKVILGMVG